MGKLVYIMGKSGTGKSRSMKNIPAASFALVNPEGKDLPFGKDAAAFGVEKVCTDKADEIVNHIKRFAKKYNIVVVDDFQTVMTNEFMRRSSEVGYQKWTDIGKHAWEIAETAKQVGDDVIVYVLCHTEENDNGGEKIKTLGKLLDQNVVLESKSTIVLKTVCEDGKYFFATQNNGKDTVKSPEGMFPAYAIQNDLWYVDNKIRDYYGLNKAMSDESLAQADSKAVVDAAPKKGRSARKASSDTPASSSSPSSIRSREEVIRDNKAKEEAYVEAQAAAVDSVSDGKDEVPFEKAADALDAVPAPEMEAVPRRTRKPRNIVPEDNTLKEDTYFYIPDADNYVKKHAGDVAPEGGQVIDEKTFGEGIKRIAQEGQQPTAAEEQQTEDAAPSSRRRRRR